MAIRVGINGLGRIGRNALRAAEQHPEIEIVAVNDLADAATLTHLLKYDSILGVYPGSIDLAGDAIVVDGKRLKVLADRCGVNSGIMTTVHASPSSQRLLDAPHRDLRRARAAALSIIPTTTGAVRAMTKVMPELEGKFLGMAIRVPVPNVSLIDVTVVTKEPVTVDGINTAFREAAAGTLKDIVAVSNAPLVSIDFMMDPHSAIVDAASTMVVGDHLAKVLAWYDNEWGYACRLLDLASFVGAKLGDQATPQLAVAGRDGG